MQALKDKSILRKSSVLEDLSMIGQLFSIASTTKPTTFKSTFNSIDGILDNGAILSNDKSCVINLGGVRDGSYTLIVNSPEAANYNMTIKYASPDNSRPLILDINNKYIATYYLPKTVEDSETIDAIFSFKVKLNVGENKIKFHGDGFNLAPDLAEINLNMLKSVGSYNLTTVSITEDSLESVNVSDASNLNEEVKEEALIEHSKVNVIEDKNNGKINEGSNETNESKSYIIQDIYSNSVNLNKESLKEEVEIKIDPIEVMVSVPSGGLYDFSIPYMELGITKIKIDINGISTGVLYNLNNKDNTVVNLHLNSGQNKIKIYN